MERAYITDKTFEKEDASDQMLPIADYENCIFNNCDFANADFSDIHFSGCTFTDCNISMVKMIETALGDVVFKNCKMTGIHFEQCNKFMTSLSFDNCHLNLCSFYKLKLKRTLFKNSVLHEVDFTEADISESVFDNCDLAKAVFENTNLEKADLRTSFNYSIDPDINRIKKATFSVSGIAGLLHKYDIIIDQ